VSTHMTTKPPLADKGEIARALRLIVGDNVTEIRALDANMDGREWTTTYFGYFDDADKAAEAVSHLKVSTGVYFTLNPVDPALLGRAYNKLKKAGKGNSTQDTHITRRRWLPIDCDANRPSGVSATDEQHETTIERARLIREFLQSLGWPAPIFADSGNGGHLLFRIDSTDDETVKRCLAALAARFNDGIIKVDQSVDTLSRIWKLYGTLAAKGDSTPLQPHRMSRILETPDELETVTIELLESLAEEAPREEAKQPPALTSVVNKGLKPLDVPEFISRHNLDVGEPHDWSGSQGAGIRWVFQTSPMCEHHDGAAFLLQHGSGAISASCHHDSCSWKWTDLRERLEPAELRSKPSNRVFDESEAPYTNGQADDPDLPIEEKRETEKKPAITYERLTCQELDDGDFSIEYYIQDVLAAGQPGIISGRFKTLKTTVLCDMAISMATATKFLGHFYVPNGLNVGVMSGESGKGTLQETARRICIARGINLRDITGLYWSTTLPKIGKLAHTLALRQFITENELHVLFIDPSYLAMCGVGDDAGNLFAVGALLVTLTELGELTGCTIVLCCHNKRAKNYDIPELGDVSWAGTSEWARQWLLLNRRRDWDVDTGSHWLWMVTGGSAGHASVKGLDVIEGRRSDIGGRRWEVSVVNADDAKTAHRKQTVEEKLATKEAAEREEISKVREAIKNALRTTPDNKDTVESIKRRCGHRRKSFDLALAVMIREGELADCTVEKGNKQSYPGYQLVFKNGH